MLLTYNREMGDSKVHQRIALLRTERGMSRRELAEALDLNPQTIGFLERGDYAPSLALALRISELFALPLEQVFSVRPFPPLREVLREAPRDRDAS
jgi:DNA-binding XRE family transcriptional regulator